MRHHNKNKKFSRVRKVRIALVNSLARSLILHQKIETTETKAKGIKSFVEKLVTKSKNKTLANMRAITPLVGPKATKILVEDLAKKYADRKGGYTRIIKSKRRLSDGSKMAIIEFV